MQETDLIIRQISQAEVYELITWATLEGWNPGRYDGETLWSFDRHAFIAAQLDNELIGGGAIINYQGAFGFMGLFIVKPEHRGKGYGRKLWHARKKRLLARLEPDASIGMEGVPEMVRFYEKGGFSSRGHTKRMRFEKHQNKQIPTYNDPQVSGLDSVPFDQILDFDRQCFPADRAAFLKALLSTPETQAWIYRKREREDLIDGYVIVRRAIEGFRIGPLFARTPKVAEALFDQARQHTGKDVIFIDIPEKNASAQHAFSKYKLDEVFGCERMYLGRSPDLNEDFVYGLSSFEAG